ncbi:MAG: hypothetical protein K0M45_01870 [Candidatus Paracaedibacteraceae bacterium]|nr:hypothetical protein [Candidatus Paracaedibacteraceae bacterium]
MKTSFKAFLSAALLSSNLSIATEDINSSKHLASYNSSSNFHHTLPQSKTMLNGKPGEFEVSLSISSEDLKDALSSRYLSLFNGRKECKLIRLNDIIKAFQAANSAQPKLIMPEAGPLFDWVKAEMSQMAINHPQLQFLVKEIDDDIISHRFDIGKLDSYGLRVLAAISTEPTPDALAVFKEFNGYKTDRNMRANWQSAFSTAEFIGNHSIYSHITMPPYISERLRKLLNKEMKNLVQSDVQYPIFDKGKLGLATLLEAFINRHYLIPISDKPQTAHGIPMTPFLFGYHDALHNEADMALKDGAFKTAAYHTLHRLAQGKIDVEQLVKPVAEFMVGKLKLIDKTMSNLLNLYFTHYLPQHSMTDLKKALVGFFEMVHEEFKISSKVFSLSNFDDILKDFLGEGPLEDKEIVVLNPEQEDILKTDPLSGVAALTSEAMLDALLAAGIPAKEQDKAYYPSELRFKRQDLEGRRYRIDVKEEPMLITVMLKVENGIEYTWDIYTLKYMLSESLDEVGLLKIAGIKIVPPSLTELGSENGREIALGYLADVEKSMELCRTAFKTSAFELIGAVPAGQQKSLWQNFWDKSMKLEKQLKTAAAQVE